MCNIVSLLTIGQSVSQKVSQVNGIFPYLQFSLVHHYGEKKCQHGFKIVALQETVLPHLINKDNQFCQERIGIKPEGICYAGLSSCEELPDPCAGCQGCLNGGVWVGWLVGWWVGWLVRGLVGWLVGGWWV